MKIFISYAQCDFENARQLYDILEKAGLNPWMDTNILPGETVSHAVRQAIQESDYFLALLSQKALSQSGRIHKELLLAKEKSEENPDHKIFVIPVRLEDFEIDKEFLHDRQPLDLFQSPEKELEKLLRVFIPENTEKDKTDSPSPVPLLVPDSESVRIFIQKARKPNPRNLILFCTCFLILLISGLWYIIFPPHPENESLKSGDLYLNSGRYAEALAKYELALGRNPDSSQAQTGRKKAEIFNEVVETEYKPEDMLTRLENIPGIPKDDPHIRLMTANLYAQTGKEKQAEDIYLEIIRNHPEIAEAGFSLGVMYNKQGKKELARNMYEEAVKISKDNLRYLDNLAWIYFETGQYGKSFQSYEKMLKDDDRFLLAYAEIAKALWMNKQPELALRHLKTLAEKIEDDRISGNAVNKDSWFFPVENEHVILDNLTAKKYYAAYSLAVTYYLLGDTFKAETQVNKAKTLNAEYSDMKNISILIDQDISDIEKKFPESNEIKNRAEKFRKKFLTADQIR